MAEVVVVLPEGITGNERGFFIINDKHKDKVLEVDHADPKPGAEVSVGKKKDGRELNQLWYVDHHGFLRSKLNHFAIEANRVWRYTVVVCVEEKKKCHMRPYTVDARDARQQWKLEEKRIINQMFCNECLEIKGGLRPRARDDIICKPYQGKEEQHWHAEFLD